MQRSSLLIALSEETTDTYILRDGVLEKARSKTVRLSIYPSSAFNVFQPADFSDDDLARTPVRPLMFAQGKVFQQGFNPQLRKTDKEKGVGTLCYQQKLSSVRHISNRVGTGTN